MESNGERSAQAQDSAVESGLDDAASDTEETLVEDEADATQPTEAQIFISYRVHPDEAVAAALKVLIEGCLDPVPFTFVASVGGLRPREIGFKPQLQEAVQSAKAFVGIITNASKDREWIFFEAGAAWGRKQLYAPLLVDTEPKDLPASIADYQAFRASSRDEVRLVLTDIAGQIGASFKAQSFARRYGTFERTVNNYKREQAEGNGKKSKSRPIWEAIKLKMAGHVDEGNQRLDALEANAPSTEEKADIRLTRIAFEGEMRREDVLQAFESVDAPLKSTAAYHRRMAIFEPRLTKKIEHLKQCAEIAPQNSEYRRDALIGIAERTFESGMESEALTMLVTYLGGGDRQLRANAARIWCTLNGNADARAKLLVLAVGLWGSEDKSLLMEATRVAFEAAWPALSMFFGRWYKRVADDGSAANELGRVCMVANLPSLAYEAFSAAADSGITVAKANMANLLSQGPVAIAGLRILQQHSGDFDAAARGYPFETRMVIEDIVQKERERAHELAAAGENQFNKIAVLADGLMASKVEPLQALYRRGGKDYIFIAGTGEDEFVLESIDEEHARISFCRLSPMLTAWGSRQSDAPTGMFRTETDRSLVGVELNLASGDDKGTIARYSLAPTVS